MNGKQEIQESEIYAVLSPLSSPRHDHHPPHINNNLQNEDMVISEPAKDKAVDEKEDQKAIRKRKIFAPELYELKSMKRVFPKIHEKGKCPMSGSYELKPINVPTFSNFEQGGTSENELKNEDDYYYNQDLAILKSIHHYHSNHGVVPYPPYLEKFIDYIETSIPNLKCRGQALLTRIITLEQHFLTVMNMMARTGYHHEILLIRKSSSCVWLYGVISEIIIS
ncbi:hypothetical protein P3S68_004731 [Capsicum galapagoense]